MKKLAGKVAIVTGGGQGVGLGIALALAESGANIVITDLDEEKLRGAVESIKAKGVEVLTVAGDVRQRSAANLAVAAATAKFGKLDILVNNAQGAKPFVPLESIDDETIALIVESGLFGTVYFMQAAFPHMKEHGGSIINLGSRQGIIGGPGFAIYAATKEGIRGLTRSAAREWGRYNIRINVICPAAMTPASADFLDKNPEYKKNSLAQTALGRFGDPTQDIGAVAVFLAGPDSGYLTGQTLNVDGGQVML